MQRVGLDSRFLLVVAAYEDVTWVGYDALILPVEWTSLSVNAACAVVLCDTALMLKVVRRRSCVGCGKMTLVRLI